jgi:alpha/beta superfamily hydrolase
MFLMQVKEVQFKSDNVTLRGELYLPEQVNVPGILVCHAMHGEGFRWLPLYREFAQKAAERGFACLLFDFRGCGLSEGKFDYGRGEQNDTRAALGFLLGQKQVDASKAYAVGRSLGGTIALYSLIDDPRVKGYALWATPPDHQRNIRNYIERTRGKLGYRFFVLLSALDRSFNVTRLIKLDLWGIKMRPRDVRWKLMTLNGSRLMAHKNNPPILLIIGDEDEFVSVSEERDFEESIPGNKRLIVLKGTGHTFKGAEEKVASTTIDWFVDLQNSLTQETSQSNLGVSAR